MSPHFHGSGNDLTKFTGRVAQIAVQEGQEWLQVACAIVDTETGDCRQWEPCPEGYRPDPDPTYPDWCYKTFYPGENTVEDNLFGPLDKTADGATAALLLNGAKSFAKGNDFTKTDLIGFETEIVDGNEVITSPGSIFLGRHSSYSFIYQTDRFPGTPPPCNQVLDWGSDNVVYGWADLCPK